jgi:plasmid maintenance system antidote protein VapI
MEDLQCRFYTPGHYLGLIAERLSLRNDAQLVRRMGIGRLVINRIRNRKTAVTPDFMMLVHDMTGISIGDQRYMLGLPRRMYITA